MNPNYKILIATDFSTHSDLAVKIGDNIQRKSGATITLVHISETSPVWDLPATDEQAKNLLGRFQKEINTSIEKSMRDQLLRCNVSAETLIKFGTPQKELLELIDSTKPDLLIMGHQGRSGLFSLGSFAEKMIATSPVPVLVGKSLKDIEKVCCLIDLSKPSREAIDYTKRFAQLFGARATYLTSISDISSKQNIPFMNSVFQFSDEERMKIKANAKALIQKNAGDLSNDEIQVEISPLRIVESLTKSLTEMEADLAVMSKHNRGPVERFFIGSTSIGILKNFNSNILVLP